jgi:hypothetical protein
VNVSLKSPEPGQLIQVEAVELQQVENEKGQALRPATGHGLVQEIQMMIPISSGTATSPSSTIGRPSASARSDESNMLVRSTPLRLRASPKA